jgi:hypothetical protein
MVSAQEALQGNFVALSAAVLAITVGSSVTQYIKAMSALSEYSPRALSVTFLGFAWFIAGSLTQLSFSFDPEDMKEVLMRSSFVFGGTKEKNN